MAQEVEHFLGKEEVTGSSPVIGSEESVIAPIVPVIVVAIPLKSTPAAPPVALDSERVLRSARGRSDTDAANRCQSLTAPAASESFPLRVGGATN